MTKGYSIIRFKQYNLQGANNIFNHNFRKNTNVFINKDRTNLNIYAFSKDNELKIFKFNNDILPSDFNNFFDNEKKEYNFEIPNNKIKSNTICAHEFLLTASPTFFKNLINKEFENNEDYSSLLSNDKFNSWLKKSMMFIANLDWYTNGTKLYTLHLDEKVPHIHVITLPLFKNNEKNTLELNHTKLMGNRLKVPEKFRKLQQDYANTLQEIGLQKGIDKQITGREHVPINRLREINNILLTKINEHFDAIKNGEIDRDQLINKITNNDKKERLYAYLTKDNEDINISPLKEKITQLQEEITNLKEENSKLRELLQTEHNKDADFEIQKQKLTSNSLLDIAKSVQIQ